MLGNLVLLTAAAILAAAGQILFKLGATGRQSLFDFLNAWILVGLFAYGSGTIIWIAALSQMQLVHVYAFTALTFVLVYVGGVALLGERVDFQAIVGICLVLTGLYFIMRGSTLPK